MRKDRHISVAQMHVYYSDLDKNMAKEATYRDASKAPYAVARRKLDKRTAEQELAAIEAMNDLDSYDLED
jgi:hypothetical protein